MRDRPEEIGACPQQIRNRPEEIEVCPEEIEVSPDEIRVSPEDSAGTAALTSRRPAHSRARATVTAHAFEAIAGATAEIECPPARMARRIERTVRHTEAIAARTERTGRRSEAIDARTERTG